jgi:hypothetical protein
MTDSLAGFLTAQTADRAHLEHATRYLMAEWSDDLPSEAMLDELARAGFNSHDLKASLTKLTEDPDALEAGTLSVLAFAWDQPELSDAARGSILEAKSKLPVVESAVIAVAVMYGLWLIATKGRRRHTKVVQRTPDGGYVEIESTEWWDAAGPLRTITDMFASTSTDTAGSTAGSDIALPPSTDSAQVEGSTVDPGQPSN